MELGHLLTRSGLIYPEVSSRVCHDSFCQLGNSVSLPCIIWYYEAFYLQVVKKNIYIGPLKTKLNLNYIYRLSSYRAVNTLRLGYKNL
jgi:hypothetical protein